MSRRSWLWFVAVTAVAGTVATVVLVRSGDDSTAAVDADVAVSTAEVVRATLVDESTYTGTLGRSDRDPITTALAGTVTSVAAVGDLVDSGDTLFAIDGEPVIALTGDIPNYRTLARWTDSSDVPAGRDGVVTWVPAEGDIVAQGDVLFEIDGEPVVVLYGDVPAYRDLVDLPENLVGDDVAQLERALESLGHTEDADVTIDDEFTSATADAVAALQSVIGADDDGELHLGEYVIVDEQQEILSVEVEVGDPVQPGTVAIRFADGDPLTGDDVTQLQRALVDLGHLDAEAVRDGEFDEPTDAAVRAFQAAAGQEVDGEIGIGEIVYIDQALRISEAVADVGSNVNPGSPVVSATRQELQVTLDLPAADQGTFDVGDEVTIELPDGTEIEAVTSAVATTASVSDGAAVFEIVFELTDASAAAGLDEAPVDISIVTDSVDDVIAVPVSALVVLREGGYAVEVVTGTRSGLVAVEPGFFADGLVEVAGAVEPGDLVVVP